MTPHPLHKWKSFWLGILAVGFLGWAWAYSFRNSVGFEWIPQSARFVVFGDSATGSIGLTYLPILPPFQFEQKFDLEISDARYSEKWFPDAWGRRHYEVGGGIELAHWFLIVLFLMQWLAFLFWRARKQRKPSP